MKKLKFIVPLLVVLLIFSCEKDNNIPLNQQQVDGLAGNPFLENFGDSIEARFMGSVINEEGNPIVGANITIGNMMAITDANGVFSIESTTVYEKFAYIKASKNGFIDGSRSLVPTSGVNQVVIMLLDADPNATIGAGQPFNIGLPNGTSVNFTGDFQTVNGFEYLGNVQVVLKHLNPDNEAMALQMPGALIAENTSGDLQALETYGMIAVKLIGENGEELNIAEGTTAELKIPVPTNATNPPETIPLWYFDETYGYWKEEGTATLQGDKYVGEVSHFSFWNCDIAFDTVQLCVTIVDDNNNPLPNTIVQLQRDSVSWTSAATGYTNANGEVCGIIPANETLTLTIPDFGCVDNDYSESVGPFDSDTNITITVSDSNAQTTNLTGVFNDCSGTPATNGYVYLNYNDSVAIIPITDGTLDLSIDYCLTDTEYAMQFFDLENNQSTTIVTGNLTTPVTDLGTQMSCTTLLDADADGVLDFNEDLNANGDYTDDDTDQDGTPDYLDVDDDGDGIDTIDEDYDSDGDPMNNDSDGDSIPDYLDNLDVLIYATEVSGTGCLPSLIYDFDTIISTVYFELINNTYTFYLTEADALADVNPLASPFIDDGNTQIIYVKAVNTITNQFDIAEVYLYLEFLDTDGDGLTDCEETSGIDSDFSDCSPNGNITDPNVADSDGDGFDDCIEATNGTNPNDASSVPTSPSIIVNDQTVTEGDIVEYAFTLSSPAIDNIVINFEIVSAEVDFDDYQIEGIYGNNNINITIEAGSTSGVFAIVITDDTEVEGSENFTVVGTLISGSASAIGEATISIIDND